MTFDLKMFDHFDYDITSSDARLRLERSIGMLWSAVSPLILSLRADMTMDEVREYERTIQEATNEKIGIFPPSISISEMPLSSCTLSGPASAPTTPVCTDAPEFLSVPKDRARKKSAPETLTLPDAATQNQSGVPQGSMLVPVPNQNHSPWPSSDSDQAELGGE